MTKQFIMTVDMENAAFMDDGQELARILRAVAERIDGFKPSPGLEMPLYDINGNKVGHFTVS